MGGWWVVVMVVNNDDDDDNDDNICFKTVMHLYQCSQLQVHVQKKKQVKQRTNTY